MSVEQQASQELATITPEDFEYRPLRRAKDADQRVGQLASTSGWSSPLYENIFELNRAVAPELPQGSEGVRVGKILFKDQGTGSTYSTMGLDYHTDFYQCLYPYAMSLGAEVARSPLSTTQKLRRLGQMAGVLVAESQLFTTANHRTARALYGLITEGEDGIIPAHNAVMSFKPPEELEELILLQNIARLRQSLGVDGQNCALGGIFIDPEVHDSLVLPTFNLEAFRYGTGGHGKYFSAQSWYTYKLREATNKRLSNEKLQDQFVATLAQEKYGPAACSFVCQSPEELDTITETGAREVVSVGNQLLRMRIMSLLTGIAGGGTFPAIEDASDAQTRTRRVNKTHWEPTTPEQLL